MGWFHWEFQALKRWLFGPWKCPVCAETAFLLQVHRTDSPQCFTEDE